MILLSAAMVPTVAATGAPAPSTALELPLVLREALRAIAATKAWVLARFANLGLFLVAGGESVPGSRPAAART